MLRRPEVLEETFVPSDVVHRHDELNELAEALEPLEDGNPANNAFVFGPTGAGKTVSTRYLLGELEAEAPQVEYTLVNCWTHYSRRKVARTVLEAVSGTVSLPETHAVEKILDELRESISDPVVVVLDEADQLADDSILYDLYRIPDVSLVLIANREEELFSHLDDRVHSRLSAGLSVYFDAYSHDELVSILTERARLAFEPGVASDEVLDEIADRAAGDARAAIRTLEQAARLAKREHDTILSAEHVERAAPQAWQVIREDTLEKLTEHQRALYDVLEEDGPLGMTALYDRYCERVDDAKSKRTARRKLRKMEHYDLVTREGEHSGTTYDVVE